MKSRNWSEKESKLKSAPTAEEHMFCRIFELLPNDNVGNNQQKLRTCSYRWIPFAFSENSENASKYEGQPQGVSVGRVLLYYTCLSQTGFHSTDTCFYIHAKIISSASPWIEFKITLEILLLMYSIWRHQCAVARCNWNCDFDFQNLFKKFSARKVIANDRPFLSADVFPWAYSISLFRDLHNF